MRIIGTTSVAILAVLLGIAAPAHAQQEQHGERQDHPQQQQSRHEQSKPDAGRAQQQHPSSRGPAQEQPARRQSQNRPQERAQQPQRQLPDHQAEQRRQAEEHTPQATQQHAQQERNQPPQRSRQPQRVQQSAWQNHGSQHWDSDHRNWQQRGGYRGYRIPDARFHGYFGPSHGFRIHGLPFLVVGGYPRFQYNGYWLSLVDPWPEAWGNNWYDNDDVYVNYVDDGYYLYNQRYPGVGIAINISM